MSELQISLIATGLLVVAGVVIFNWWQERKFRRQAEQRFQGRHEDVLMREEQDAPPLREEPRIEPLAIPPETAQEIGPFEPAPAAESFRVEPVVAAEPELVREPAQADQSWPSGLDRVIDYVALLHAAEPVQPSAFAVAVQRAPGIPRPVRWRGLNQHTGAWEDMAQASPDGEFLNLAAGLQLVDRSGPAGAADIAAFCDQVQAVAGSLYAVVEFPDRQAALAAAQELDKLCAAVDVLLGVNVVAGSGAAFAATKVRALAEAAGMKLLPDGTFQYIDEQGASLFSLCNQEPAPFFADDIKHLDTHGVTLLFDVPKVADGLRAFDHMVAVANQLAAALSGQLVDDNRKALTEAGLDRIRQQLAAIYAQMEAGQVPAGSERAARLLA